MKSLSFAPPARPASSPAPGGTLFVHSLFRTASTWYWARFRAREDCLAYYEPFHESLAELDPVAEQQTYERERRSESLRHPAQARHLWAEYPFRASGVGVEGYRAEFAYEGYCGDDAGAAEAEDAYLASLIDRARGRRAVLQFCRSSLRSRRLQERFGGTHVYLLRDARSQWRSYCSFMPRSYFVASALMVPALNPGSRWFEPVAPYLWLPDMETEDEPQTALDRIRFLVLAQSLYSDAERYFLFYWLWLVSLVENASLCDFVLEPATLPEDERSADGSRAFHREIGLPVDLSDFRSAAPLPPEAHAPWMDGIEGFAMLLLRESRGDLIARALARIGERGWGLGPEVRRTFERLVGDRGGPCEVPELVSRELRSERRLIARDLARQSQIEAECRRLSAIASSPSYQLGNRLLAPARWVRTVSRRLRSASGAVGAGPA